MNYLMFVRKVLTTLRVERKVFKEIINDVKIVPNIFNEDYSNYTYPKDFEDYPFFAPPIIVVDKNYIIIDGVKKFLACCELYVNNKRFEITIVEYDHIDYRNDKYRFYVTQYLLNIHKVEKFDFNIDVVKEMIQDYIYYCIKFNKLQNRFVNNPTSDEVIKILKKNSLPLPKIFKKYLNQFVYDNSILNYVYKKCEFDVLEFQEKVFEYLNYVIK